MPKYNKHEAALLKIIDYCVQIEKTMDHFGYTFDIFLDSFIYQNSCAMCILQIGELTRHFDDEFRKIHSSIPWNKIIGMRNFLAHEYMKVNYDEFWKAITHDIPELKSYCLKILPSVKG